MAGTMEIQNDRKAEIDRNSGTTENYRNSGTTGNDRTYRNDLPTLATLGEGKQSHCHNNKISWISFFVRNSNFSRCTGVLAHHKGKCRVFCNGNGNGNLASLRHGIKI
jgi:hypothetical protein